MQDIPALTPEAAAELAGPNGPMPEFTKLVDAIAQKAKPPIYEPQPPTEGQLIEVISKMLDGMCVTLYQMRGAVGMLNGADLPAAIDKHVRDLYWACAFGADDIARLYGQRVIVESLPPPTKRSVHDATPGSLDEPAR